MTGKHVADFPVIDTDRLITVPELPVVRHIPTLPTAQVARRWGLKDDMKIVAAIGVGCVLLPLVF